MAQMLSLSSAHCPCKFAGRHRRCIPVVAVARRSPPQMQQATGVAHLRDLGMLMSLAVAAPAMADETAANEFVDAGDAALTPTGALLLLSPVILYSIFYGYRAIINPKAKISDFLFIVAAAAVFGNIIAIVGFKTRLF